MIAKAVCSFIFLALLSLTAARPAQAQWAVIDVGAIGQLIQEVQTLRQQLQTAQNQLSQAQAEYASITGNRGMEQLLSGTPRNYLPADWTQVSAVMGGSSAGYPALATDYATLLNANAVLTPAQVAALSAAELSELTFARESAAMSQATTRAALATTSARFNSLQQLVSAIGSAADQKATLDLNARIGAEAAMLQNEHTKLELLNELAQADQAAHAEQARERAIADQGSLRQLPQMGL